MTACCHGEQFICCHACALPRAAQPKQLPQNAMYGLVEVVLRRIQQHHTQRLLFGHGQMVWAALVC